MAVRSALQHLTPASEGISRLAYFEHLTQQEIATRLRLPLGTVKSRTFEALRVLAEPGRRVDGYRERGRTPRRLAGSRPEADVTGGTWGPTWRTMSRMRFGIFMAPFHPAGENPTILLDSDLELIEHLDELGYDEAWIGEHHSAGSEIIASPEIFIAAAAQRTRHIKLGTGVISASYHNPLWVAERAVQLDHMTKGRFMLGLGPGALPSDAAMIGLDMPQTRELLEDAVDIITRLHAQRGAGHVRERPLEPGRRPPAPAALHPSASRDRHRRASPRRPARAWPVATATACCRSAPRPPPASTCSACTGT